MDRLGVIRAVACATICLFLASCEYVFAALICAGNTCWDVPRASDTIELARPVTLQELADATNAVAAEMRYPWTPIRSGKFPPPSVVETHDGRILLNGFPPQGVGIASMVEIANDAGSQVRVTTEGIGPYWSKPFEQIDEVQSRLIAGLRERLNSSDGSR